MVEIFQEVTFASVKSNFGGPAGGSALERASPPIKEYSTWLVETEIHPVLEEQYFIAHTPGQIVAQMTRRAFPALRVIRLQGKSCPNGPVKKV